MRAHEKNTAGWRSRTPWSNHFGLQEEALSHLVLPTSIISRLNIPFQNSIKKKIVGI